MGSVVGRLSGTVGGWETKRETALIIVQAVCDWPACAFAKELIEAYPNAKVILSTRDVDTWHAYVLIRAFAQKKRLCLTPTAVLS
jgi:hypothetical protein